MHFVRVGFLLFALLLSACSLFDGSQSQPVVTETPTIPTPIPSPTPSETVEATASAPTTSPDYLNIWIFGDLAPDSDAAGGEIIATHLDSYLASHPELTLNVEVKEPTVQGGTLSYLRTGREVAPSILPDIIALPVDQLRIFSSEQLIFSLDDLISSETMDDLFPAAQSLAMVDGTAYGFPFTLNNLQHVAYDTEVFSDTLPSTWDALVAVEEASFVFPAAGFAGAQMALQIYMELGGDLGSDPSHPQLDADLLADVLSQFSRGRTEGFITIQSSNVATLSEAWQVYMNGSANIVQTDAAIYLQEQTGVSNTTFAAGPGVERPLTPMVSGLAWSISTPDPDRQALSADIISWLVSSENMGQWSLEAQMLPSRRTAFEYWGTDSYTTFLRLWSERAEPFPEGANNDVMSALSTAVFDVLTLSKSPQLAAEQAAASLQ